MAGDSQAGEKTELPTPRKIQESREKGQVARSQDLATATLLLAAFLLFFFVAMSFLDGVISIERDIFGMLAHGRITFENVLAVGVAGVERVVVLMMPIFLCMLVAGVAINLVQVGFMITPQVLSPDINRLNPIKGIGRIFSMRGVMRLLFGLLKLAVVGTVIVHGFLSLTEGGDGSLFSLLRSDLHDAVDYSHGAIFLIGIRASTALLILAILDFGFQKWQHQRDLMMTKQEVREEHKRMEGDPKIKERRRRIQQQLALRRMMQDVPKADVVITNPTHVSCAIKYQPQEMHAPRLLAKGKGVAAHRIREIAAEHGVPIVEEPPLARLVYQTTEVGDEIPPDLYKPVAEVLAYVYRMSGGREPAAAR